ncbi:helicase-exonuclease AddAB subunit AddB [Planococcus lenghuensis]|uniref:ATP-dependent helicase/deoxyribonuclease subunit B n=1 Tax=Planococcus lenghuensis TaxID=2213202 RepID=A0A1Q2L0H3_9BACL|nr:helicase-exonuclease AddAB subunit AddB [Planococcus lenghuensis]AQQ53931.1 helicase-exonuclease AddAB subunit AddB [Planococcus lenghuensis]
MSLRIVYGRAGSGKTRFIQEEIAETLEHDADGDPIFFVVPDQMSFSTEYRLSTGYSMKGLIRAQAVTFKRLAWRVLQEVGGISRKEVNTFGYRMLIRSLLEEHKEDFQLFRRAAGKRGFTDQIEELLKEFARYCVDCGELKELRNALASAGAPRTLLDKAGDLELILTEIESRLGTTYVDSEGHLRMLAEKVRYSELIKTADIYIDGFVTFTAQEYEIIRELMKYAKSVTIALPMDELTGTIEEQSLFYQPVRTARRLTELAAQDGIESEPPVHMTEPRRFNNRDTAHLERCFDMQPVVQTESEGYVRVTEASNRRAEIHAVARKIREQAMQGMRYRDMAVLYRQPEAYNELIETIFAQYELPVFISRKKSMLHHPLIELSRSALEAVLSGLSYEPVFRAVKTDLFFPGESVHEWRERGDVLENFIIANGIYGERWFDENRWFYKKYRGLELHTVLQTDEEKAQQEELHAVRDMILAPLAGLRDKLDGCRTGRDVAEALFVFIEDLGVYEKIQRLKEREEKEHRLLAATEHEQAWDRWIEVLDQFVLMFGSQELELTTAVKILDEGFETLEFSRIPPSIDQVTVQTVDIARLINIRSVYVIGATDGVLPKRIEGEGLLTDSEREWFMNVGYELAPTSRMRLLDEAYVVYRAFSSASDTLTVSYPIADEEGGALLPSLYVQQLLEMFSIAPEPAVMDPEDMKGQTQLAYISHPRPTLMYLTSQVRKGELSPVWQAVLDYYKKDLFYKSVVDKILAPIKPNEAEQLDEELTESLYGTPVSSSVSRVEQYFSCPFAQFAAHGLQLKDRSRYELESPQIGDLFHAAIKWISDEVGRLGVSWASLTKKQCRNLAKQAMEELSPYFVNQILISSSRYRYIQHKLEGVIRQTAAMLSKHAQVTGFSPIAMEVAFGPKEAVPPLEVNLKRGRKMYVRGRIDRVDSAEIDGKPYMRVLDYKMSGNGLDLNEVYRGLALQTFTYLDVALTNSGRWLGTEAEPAGVLYFHMHNPMLKQTKLLTAEELETELLKAYKMNGLIVEDPEVIRTMDGKAEGHSKIIPVYLKKDGQVSPSQSKTVELEDMQMIREFTRHKHQQAGNGILGGDTRIDPYKLKDKTPCQFCSYRPVCQFDPADPDQKYRRLPSNSPKESIDLMKEELNEDDSD